MKSETRLRVALASNFVKLFLKAFLERRSTAAFARESQGISGLDFRECPLNSRACRSNNLEIFTVFS
jgi:hypothetical protein